MAKQTKDIYKSLVKAFFPDDMLDHFEVIGLEEVITGKTFFGNYSEKELHIYLDEKESPQNLSRG